MSDRPQEPTEAIIPAFQYSVAVHHIDLEVIGPDEEYVLPESWEPFAVARQGNDLVVLGKRQIL